MRARGVARLLRAAAIAGTLIVTVMPLAPARAQGDASFDAEYARLRKGREYGTAKTGAITYRTAAVDGSAFEAGIDVPESYDPGRRWPVRIQLHGGVNRPRGGARRGGPNRIAGGVPQIYVHPEGWSGAQWWHGNQVMHVADVLSRLKREYNVDESRVYVTGFSDGGTGAFYFGMRDATPFSTMMPLHGNLAVLANPSVRVEGQMYPGNLVNRPMFATNGGRDHLYPISNMTPLVALLRRAGVDLTYRPLYDAGHELSWWPAERERFDRFVMEHPRPAHPARLSWETERADRYNRIDWLVITGLGRTASSAELPDAGEDLFPRARPSGRVDVERKGNVFEARTRGVRTFMLLLSPDVVDFGAPVTVTVNGKPAFNGRLERDASVLRQWAARDLDRDRLYAAELRVEVQ